MMTQIKYKAIYRLSRFPSERIILRKIAELNGGTMRHDFIEQKSTVEVGDELSLTRIRKQFYEITAQMHKSRAFAEAIVNLPVKTVRSEFDKAYTDVITTRLEDNNPVTIPLKSIRGERRKLYDYAQRAALECDIS